MAHHASHASHTGHGSQQHTLHTAKGKGHEIVAPSVNLDGGHKSRAAHHKGHHATHSKHGHHPHGAGHMRGKR